MFAYRYHDAKGNEFVSYKTRLLPFLQQSRFGPFLEMWKEMLNKYPIIPKLPWLLDANLSFELWGARNPHLVKYSIPLATSLLFARKGQKILPPSELVHESVLGLQAPTRGEISADYTWNYQQSREILESTLSETEDGYMGVEGEVWYLQGDTKQWILFKCKPETIELIHWAAGGIGKNIIRATIENAFENWDEPTIDQVKQLLKEEFAADEIEKIHYSITKHLKEATEYHLFKENVLLEYATLGVSILDDKISVMRQLSKWFDKKQMRKVYGIVWNEEIK